MTSSSRVMGTRGRSGDDRPMTRGIRTAIAALLLFACAVTLAPAQSPAPLPFADWTAVSADEASGVLNGASVRLVGSGGLVTAGSVTDGSSAIFASGPYTPPLAHSDVVNFSAGGTHAYTLKFGFPVKDPVLHLASLGSTLHFAPGVQISKLSGDGRLTISGTDVIGQPDGPGDDAHGTIQLSGSFNSIAFVTESTVPTDGVYLQVGAAPTEAAPPPAYQNVGAIPGLALRWHLDGFGPNNAVFDSSGRNHHGVAPAPPTLIDGRFDKAVRFAGGSDNYWAISTDARSDLDIAHPTIQLRIRRSTPPADNRTLIAYGGSACGQPTWELRTLQSNVAFVVRTGAGTQIVSGGIPSNAIWDGNWHTITVSYDGTPQVYLDKDLYSPPSVPDYGQLVFGSGNGLAIADRPGPDQCATSHHLDADYDEVVLYDHVLTADEITYLAEPTLTQPPALPAPPAASPISARYHLDTMKIEALENIHSTPDSSGHNLDGDAVSAFSAPGRWGNAFRLLNQGQGFIVHDSPYLEPRTVTVMAWVRSDTPQSGVDLALGPRDNTSCTTASWRLSVDSAGTPYFSAALVGEDGGRSVASATAGGGGNLWDGQWHAVAGTFDGATTAVWIDGVRRAFAAVPQRSGEIDYRRYSEHYAMVGQGPSCAGAPAQYVGDLDEVRLYDRALTNEELQYLQDPTAVDPPNLPAPSATGPVNTTAPTLSGLPKVGSTLTCEPGVWTPAPTSYVYVWQRAPRDTPQYDHDLWHAIDGAAGTTYTVQAADDGSSVRCLVRAYSGQVSNEKPSRSLRADVEVPNAIELPAITGGVKAETELTCKEGTWAHGPDPFDYQWVRDNTPIPGATQRTYTPTGGSAEHPDGGDRDHWLYCVVVGHNDVGASPPARSPGIIPVYTTPQNTAPPSVYGLIGEAEVGDDLHCNPGGWYEDYATHNIGGDYARKFRWTREGVDIPGAVGADYAVKLEDLGREVACVVTASNPLGSTEASSRRVLLTLPTPTHAAAGFFRTGGRNEFDPVNLMTMDQRYLNALAPIQERHIIEGLPRYIQTKCATTAATGYPEDPSKVVAPVSQATRCRILVASQSQGFKDLFVQSGGLYWEHSGCTRTVTPTTCPNLGVQSPSIDPSHPPALTDAERVSLAGETPLAIIWDFGQDGHTDAICPGTAQVLRTMLKRGRWTGTGLIVYPDSAQSHSYGGVSFGIVQPENYTGTETGRVRQPQPFVCRGSIDPPPDPKTGPCVQDGTVGRVHVTGNLCPINVRAIPQAQIDALKESTEEGKEGALYNILADFSLKQGLRSAVADDPLHRAYLDAPALAAWAPARLGSPRTQRDGTLASSTVDATAYNAQAALSSFALQEQITEPQVGYTGPTLDHLIAARNTRRGTNDVPPTIANFATDQIYTAVGPMLLNGVKIDPTGDLAAMMIPSDAGQIVPNVHQMTVFAKQAQSSLRAQGQELTLGAARQLKTELGDAVSNATPSLLDKINLDDVDIGPFKLTGSDVDVKLNPDGTARITAKAVLPGLLTGAGGPEITAGAELNADAQGNIRVVGVHIKYLGTAWLFGVGVRDLELDYGDGGVHIAGEVYFGPGPGIDIRNFELGPDGEFRALDIGFEAPPGTGIPVGPGVFLTRVHGGLRQDPWEITGGAGFSAPAPTGACPVMGADGNVTLHWSPGPFKLLADAQMSVLCIPLADMKFSADTSGLMELYAHWGVDAGPLFLQASLDGRMKVAPSFLGQIKLDGSGGIHDIPIIGDLEAQLHGVLSNKGMAVCGSIKVLFARLAGGVGVRFPAGRLPLGFPELIANLVLFTGCDLSSFEVLPSQLVRSANVAQAGTTTVDLEPEPGDVTVLSLEGAGGAPHVTLRSPSGKVYDFTHATEPVTTADSMGTIIDPEDRTVVMLHKPQAGRWTIQSAPGSPTVVRVRSAGILPAPQVSARVTGHGAHRALHYRVSRIAGQVVVLEEQAEGGLKRLATVRDGGSGTVPFTVGETRSPKRTIMAEVVQDGMPRKRIEVAHFVAANPRLRAPRVRLVRRGAKVLARWTRVPLAARYGVVVRTSDGGVTGYDVGAKHRRLLVPAVGKRHGARVSVRAQTPAGRRGPAGVGRLAKPRAKHHKDKKGPKRGRG
jgi:hypothetical protein